MKYRVMITSTLAGLPDDEYGTYDAKWQAAVVAWFFNLTHVHYVVAYVEEVSHHGR